MAAKTWEADFRYQAIRASLKAMEEVLIKLRQTGCPAAVEADILTLPRIHELVRFDAVRNNGRH